MPAGKTAVSFSGRSRSEHGGDGVLERIPHISRSTVSDDVGSHDSPGTYNSWNLTTAERNDGHQVDLRRKESAELK